MGSKLPNCIYYGHPEDTAEHIVFMPMVERKVDRTEKHFFPIEQTILCALLPRSRHYLLKKIYIIIFKNPPLFPRSFLTIHIFVIFLLSHLNPSYLGSAICVLNHHLTRSPTSSTQTPTILISHPTTSSLIFLQRSFP